jgi:glycosyltransferase involved in cell wall biosynthesis
VNVVPDVSVVVPTCNREEQLLEAVRSALAQQGVDIEVIVVDDSADGSAATAAASLDDRRVRYVRRPEPSGGAPAFARNDGWKLARGRFVHFLDDDDVLADGALRELVSALDRAPNRGVAVGTVHPFGRDVEALRQEQAYFASATSTLRHTHSRAGLVARLLYGTTPLVNSACMIRRTGIEAIGGYATDVPRCEDVDFYLRAIRRFGFVFVDRPVVHYRTGAQSLMHTATTVEMLQSSYRRIYKAYRREHGFCELLGLHVLAELIQLLT